MISLHDLFSIEHIHFFKTHYIDRGIVFTSPNIATSSKHYILVRLQLHSYTTNLKIPRAVFDFLKS